MHRPLVKKNIKGVLDEVLKKIQDHDFDDAMSKLYDWLRAERINRPDKAWQNLVNSVLLEHPLAKVLHSDPITRHSFSKPRGYAGDAELLDMIYRCSDNSDSSLSQEAKAVREYNFKTPAANAVRERRSYIAGLIDRVCAQKPNARILSLACGHLREAELCEGLKKGNFRDFFALDQDRESLALVEKQYGHYGISALNLSVKDILKKKHDLGDMDLIYSAGLYDYLNKKLAIRLTSRLFNMLACRGILLMTNFLPEISAIGYMESFMAWNLIYRSEADLIELSAGIPRAKIEKQELFVDKQENIVYLKIYRR